MDVNRQQHVDSDEWTLVTHEKVESVLQELSNDWPASLQVYNFIKSSLLWRSCYPNVKTAVFCKLNKGPDSIIATIKAEDYILTAYSCNMPDLDIVSALEGNSVIDWNGGSLLLSCIPKDLSPFIEEAMVSHKITRKNTFNSYWLPADSAKAIDIQCPDDMYLSKLEPRHATTVTQFWPYASNNSLHVITQMINAFDTVGLFTKKDSVLVSWVLNTFYGVGMLHTIEEYRRKGYGSVVVRHLVKSLGNKEINPYILTRPDNYAANSLFVNIGFKQLGQVDFMRAV